MAYTRRRRLAPRRRPAARRPVRRVRRAPLARRPRKYADSHSFKFQSQDTVITNTVVSGIGQPTATGDVFIGSQLAKGSRWSFGGSFSFNANNMMQINQVKTMFDRYKINGIKVRVIPQNNFANINGGGVLPVMRMVYDFDDNSIPTVGDIWSRRGIERRLDRPFSVYFKPKVLHTLWTASTIANSPVSAGYIDMVRTDVPHFGLKFAVKDWYATSTPNDLNLRFEITYYVTVKQQLQTSAPYSQEELVREPEPLDEEDVACENKPSALITFTS